MFGLHNPLVRYIYINCIYIYIIIWHVNLYKWDGRCRSRYEPRWAQSDYWSLWKYAFLCGGHRYCVLYTVWVTIGHMGRVGYMGHGSCCCVHIGHVIPYDATSASSDRVRMAGMLAYIGVGPHVSSVSSGTVHPPNSTASLLRRKWPDLRGTIWLPYNAHFHQYTDTCSRGSLSLNTRKLPFKKHKRIMLFKCFSITYIGLFNWKYKK